MGLIPGGPKLPEKEYLENVKEIPESFDARIQWPYCPTITFINDQSDCSSCWAEAATEAMSDRLCIASKGGVVVLLSANDLLACCTTFAKG